MSFIANMPSVPLRRIARFLAVMAIAVAAGHLAQTLAARKMMPPAVASASLPIEIVQLSSSPADAAPLPISTAAIPVDAIPNATSAMTPPEAPVVAQSCAPSMTLTPGKAGLIEVALTAPCHEQERVVLRHDGLAVTGRVGADGTLAMSIPALTAEATVDILFRDGSKIGGATQMPEVAQLQRFGVQWEGKAAFIVHGISAGASFGDKGDVTASNPGTPGDAGFVTVIGDATVENPLLAQVYTYPIGAQRPVDLVVEAAVTPETCAHDLLGEAISSSNGRTTTTDLTLTMPECSGVGDFLVLKNLASDMKIAAN